MEKSCLRKDSKTPVCILLDFEQPVLPISVYPQCWLRGSCAKKLPTNAPALSGRFTFGNAFGNLDQFGFLILWNPISVTFLDLAVQSMWQAFDGHRWIFRGHVRKAGRFGVGRPNDRSKGNRQRNSILNRYCFFIVIGCFMFCFHARFSEIFRIHLILTTYLTSNVRKESKKTRKQTRKTTESHVVHSLCVLRRMTHRGLQLKLAEKHVQPSERTVKCFSRQKCVACFLSDVSQVISLICDISDI